MGQSLPNWPIRLMYAFPSRATELWTSLEVRFVPDSDIEQIDEDQIGGYRNWANMSTFT